MSEVARRQRARVATEQEIRDHTRSLLVSQGREGVTLRAIANELGMTAPALYRYYGSREDLLRAVVSDICTELAAALAEAAAAPTTPGAPADAAAGGTVGSVLDVCRAFRRWALAHPAEFGLAFATAEQECPMECGPACQCGQSQFARAFLAVGVRQLVENGIRLPADSALPPALVTALEPYCQVVADKVAAGGMVVPPGVITVPAVHFFLQTWARLYGHVALEVFGYFKFALDDAEPLFEAMLTELAAQLAPA